MTASFLTQGYTSIFFVAIAGLANSLMWPAIFGLALDGLGRYTKIGSALLVMGISGGAVVPKIYGELLAAIPSQTAFFVCTAPCYLYILYYSMKGHNAGKKSIA
jgi:fucose permease